MEIFKAKATLKNLRLFLEFVKKFAQKKGFNAETSYALVLVAEEILVNIVNYAYPHKEGGEVEIKLSISNNIFLICIIDEGVPFNITSVKDPDITLTLAKRNIGGMGVYIVKSFMDEINYERNRNRNILTLAKYC